MSNKKIAAELTLSVRTVEDHLQHIFGKLGITRRDDLNQALGADANKRTGQVPQ